MKAASRFLLLSSLTIFSLLLPAASVQSAVHAPEEKLGPEKQHPIVGQIISRLLPRYHYSHQTLNDQTSSEILDLYLDRLDGNRMYFLASDVADFEKYRYVLDDNLQTGKIEVAYDIFNRFKGRLTERVDYVVRRLEHGFDFDLDEYYEVDRSEAPWAETVAQLDELWRLRLKNEALSLKLAEKDWVGIETTLKKRYQNFHKRFDQYDSEDVFRYFMNAVSSTFDPHTSYLSPMFSENFEIDMSLSFEGIGAQLTTEEDYTKVLRILPGGPASRSKELWENDRIIGVAQDVDGEMLDVIGMRLDDVVKKIRGPKGSTVRLEIIPSDSPEGSQTKEIILVRDEVVLSERAAQSDTVDLIHEGKNYRLGVVRIPSFYADLNAQREGKRDYKSTTRDVRNLIEELEGAQVDGIVIDLRNNGGGFLPEAIELSGLFIKDGPVVQVRNSAGAVRVEHDPDPAQVYDGPLAVLVNRSSASASEIFAAAIQDYGRGIVLGSRTFGKGTVQNLLPLNKFVSLGDESFGQIKVTIAKFYRVTGSTTQHRGVIPDILYPSIYDEMDWGESREANALPWDETSAALYQPEDHVSAQLATLRLNSKKRTATDREFQYIQENIERYKLRNKLPISLQESKRKTDRERDQERNLARVNERRRAKGLTELGKGDEIPRGQEAPDAILEESQLVLADLISFVRSGEIAKTSEKDTPESHILEKEKKKKSTAQVNPKNK